MDVDTWFLLRRVRQLLCGLWFGHEPRVQEVEEIWGERRWCRVCRRCKKVLDVI